MEVIAHRLRTSPDQMGNSLRGAMTLYHMGIYRIEVDICRLPDGKIIVYHPGSTSPDLSTMSWPEIENSIFNVMDLGSFLTLLKSCPRTICCLDIKQNSEELVKGAVELVMDKGLGNRIYFTSFQKRLPWLTIESGGELLILAKKIYPRAKTQLIATWPFNLTKIVQKYRSDAISLGWLEEPWAMRIISRLVFKFVARLVNLKKQVAEVKNSGVKVWAGIFNDPKDMTYFENLGVEGIFTDKPQLFREIIEKKKNPE